MLDRLDQYWQRAWPAEVAAMSSQILWSSPCLSAHATSDACRGNAPKGGVPMPPLRNLAPALEVLRMVEVRSQNPSSICTRLPKKE